MGLFDALMTVAGGTVDVPIYGSKGVFIASSNTILSSGMSLLSAAVKHSMYGIRV